MSKNIVITCGVPDSEVEMLQKEWNNIGITAREFFNVTFKVMKYCSMSVEEEGSKNDVTSFFFYMWNKWCESEAKIVFADSCGGYKHYWNKWVYFCNEYGCRAAVDMLYGELDEGNRDKLVARALECFDGMSEKKK